MTDGALDRLVAFADARPDAAVVGPRLLNPDGSLQRSVRGFPTLWRLATEYFFLRKLAPRTRLLNAFYAGGFDARRGPRGRGRDGRVHARPPRGGRAGRPARRGVLPLQRGDGLVLPLPAGRLEGALLPRRRVRARRRRLARRAACSARTCAGTCASSPSIAASATPSARGGCCAWRCGCAALVFRGERGRMYRDAAAWLALGAGAGAARPMTLLRLALATGVLLLPGAVVARALGLRERVGHARLVARAALRRAGGDVRRRRRRSTLTLVLLLAAGLVALPFVAARAPRRERVARPLVGASARGAVLGSCSGTSRARSAATGSSTSRGCASSRRSTRSRSTP